MNTPKPLTPKEIEGVLVWDYDIDVIYLDSTIVTFWLNGNIIHYWVKKQWFTGKGINDGRGLDNMFKQIKKINASKKTTLPYNSIKNNRRFYPRK